jgi:D-3-phosphoglycerate dehydrogenase
VGCGRIGGWMARYGAAFGMRVVGHDPFVDPWPDGIRRVPLEELVETSDVVSVHVHLSAETRGLVSAALFERMKPGAIFVNTSRGALADEAALLRALESGRLAAAGLDVLEGEPAIEGHPLLAYARRHSNLILTPHCGGFSPDAVRLVCARAAEKIRDALAG